MMLALCRGFSVNVDCELLSLSSIHRTEMVKLFERTGCEVSLADGVEQHPEMARSMISEVVLRFRPDIVICSCLGRFASMLGDISVPKVALSHVAPNLGIESDYTAMLGQACDYQVGVSSSAAESFGTPQSLVIPSGVDISRLAPVHGIPALKQRLGMTEMDKYVLYCGRFSKEKNLNRLIRAIGRLQKEGIFAVFCGEGRKVDLLSCARRHGVDHLIRIASPTYNIGDLLYGAGCCVVPSDSESFSMFHWESILADRRCIYHSQEMRRSVMECAEGNDGDYVEYVADRGEVLAEAITRCMWNPPDSTMRSIAHHKLNHMAMANRWESWILSILTKHSVRFPSSISTGGVNTPLAVSVGVGRSAVSGILDSHPLGGFGDQGRNIVCHFSYLDEIPYRPSVVLSADQDEMIVANDDHAIVIAVADVNNEISHEALAAIDYVIRIDDSISTELIAEKYPNKKIIIAEEGKPYGKWENVASLLFEISVGAI